MRFLLLLIPFLLPLSAGAEVLRISTGHYPPFVSLEEDEDFVLDLLDEVAEDMGVRFEYELNSWVRTELNVQSHLYWGAVPYMKSEERLDIYSFSDPLYSTDSVLFYYNGDEKMKALRYRDFQDLKGYHIVGIRGYYYQQDLEASGLTVSFLDDELKNLQLLTTGRVDLVLINSHVARYLIRKYFSEEEAHRFGMVPGNFHLAGVSLIMDKKYPEGEALMERFNRSIARVKERGIVEELMREHGLVPPSP